MEDGVSIDSSKTIKMGATSNPNAARLAALQERKQSIEEILAKRNKELRQLCIQEAELTGTMPTEIPLEPGESPPVFRRRVGTSFQLPQNLINSLNNEEESITSLELSMQVQANMAEAALSLANESNISKTIRRQHMVQYQYHKKQYNSLEEKLAFLKARSQMVQHSHLPAQHQQKQKKKPRPTDQEDSVSMNISMQQSDPFVKSHLRHSMRSLQHSLGSDSSTEYRTSPGHQKLTHRNSEGSSPHMGLTTPLIRPEDSLVSGIYRLSLSGYKAYMERKENGHIIPMSSHFIPSQSNPNLYQQPSPQFAQVASHTLPHGSQRSQPSLQSYIVYSQYNPIMQDYAKYSTTSHGSNSVRQPGSPSSSNHSSNHSKSSYSAPMYSNCRQYSNMEQQFRTLNSHQIQPHQQYEHDVMTAAGLGGYWKRTASGELVWCNSVPSDTWQRDKRFGSLDRRRNKRIHKRTSPLVDSKSATISVMIPYSESIKPVPVKTQQSGNRNCPDSKQLVRTQSLGSVGAQTADSVWPSDDNSSCGSEAHCINEINLTSRKQKQKEWFETSLDGPAPPTSTRSHLTTSTVMSAISPISPEEKYIETPPHSLPSPQLHKPPLEIPAESNPSPSTVHEPNMELFNNNIPKNCTLIQAGHCKPYHEETKPFEMSDFYKYSTKFKRSPVKQREITNSSPLSPVPILECNVNHNFDDDANSVIQKGIYQPLQPMKCRPLSPNNNFDRTMEPLGSPINTSLDLNQIAPHVAENFSAEMNAWYQNQEQQIDNNNSSRQGSANRSTATLV